MDFHRAPKQVRAFIGGNRSGKTTAGSVEDLWWLTGEHPYLDIRPPVYGRVAAQDLKVLKKVVIRKIEEWVPPAMIAARLKGQYGFIQQYEFKNGSVLDLMSYEMDVDKFEGVDLDFAHFDEPPPEAIYNATRARLIDRNGFVWFTLTPLDEPWIYDKVYLRADDIPDRYHVVEVEMRDNPYLDRKGIDAFEEDMDDEEVRQRSKGEFAHLSGRVIKTFKKRDPFVIESRPIPHTWSRYMGIDPHEQKPIACLWVAKNDEGQLEIYDELYEPEVETTQILAERIHEIEGRWTPEWRVIDNSANKKDRTSGRTFREDLALKGLPTILADKTDRSSRIIDLKGRFKIKSETGRPAIVVQEHCVRFIYEVMRWTWEKVPSRSRHMKDVSGRTVKKDDDLIDALLYICGKLPEHSEGYNKITPYGTVPMDPPHEDEDDYGSAGTIIPSWDRSDTYEQPKNARGRHYVGRFERARQGVY